MSRYYLYDSYTDSVAEFAKDYKGLAVNAAKAVGKGLKYAAPGMDKSIVGNLVRGGALAGAGGAATYGGYRMATRGKRRAAAESAPVDTSLKSRIRSLVSGAKSRASSAKAKVGEKARKGGAAARKQYAKLRGRGES